MAIRDIADDNDELRDIKPYGTANGYPYTYPFYYIDKVTPRNIADNVSTRSISDPDP